MGEQGIDAIDSAGTARHARTEARGRYPVGSGDAFRAGLPVALERDDPWPDAIAIALGVAAADAESPGAGHLDQARARELAAQAR